MMARVFFPLIPTSTWMSPFDLAMALISCIDPNSSSGSSSLSLSVREWMAFFFFFYYLPSEVHCIGKNEAHVAYACPYLPLFFPDGAYGWKTDLSHPCHHCVPFPSLAPLFLFSWETKILNLLVTRSHTSVLCFQDLCISIVYWIGGLPHGLGLWHDRFF